MLQYTYIKSFHVLHNSCTRFMYLGRGDLVYMKFSGNGPKAHHNIIQAITGPQLIISRSFRRYTQFLAGNSYLCRRYIQPAALSLSRRPTGNHSFGISALDLTLLTYSLWPKVTGNSVLTASDPNFSHSCVQILNLWRVWHVLAHCATSHTKCIIKFGSWSKIDDISLLVIVLMVVLDRLISYN
jgi:hypothetical protein